jgi:hypothetical protein
MESPTWLNLAAAIDVIGATTSLTENDRRPALCRLISDRKVHLRAKTPHGTFEYLDVRPPPRVQPGDLDWSQSRPRSLWAAGHGVWQYDAVYPATGRPTEAEITEALSATLDADTQPRGPVLQRAEIIVDTDAPPRAPLLQEISLLEIHAGDLRRAIAVLVNIRSPLPFDLPGIPADNPNDTLTDAAGAIAPARRPAISPQQRAFLECLEKIWPGRVFETSRSMTDPQLARLYRDNTGQRVSVSTVRRALGRKK